MASIGIRVRVLFALYQLLFRSAIKDFAPNVTGFLVFFLVSLIYDWKKEMVFCFIIKRAFTQMNANVSKLIIT